jgi:hypothetical protein
MSARFPAVTTKWVITEGKWQPAGPKVDVVHYTNATLFVNNGKVIDGRKTGLSSEDVKALKTKYPVDVIDLHDGKDGFALPLVPVGTVVDITPEGVAAGTPKTPSTGTRRIKKSKK